MTSGWHAGSGAVRQELAEGFRWLAGQLFNRTTVTEAYAEPALAWATR